MNLYKTLFPSDGVIYRSLFKETERFRLTTVFSARCGDSGTLEGLVIIAGVCPVSEGLTDVTVGPLKAGVSVAGVWSVRRLLLRGTVLGLVQVKAVTDVTEETRSGLLLQHRLGRN